MATVLDFPVDELGYNSFVRNLAIEELRRLNVDIEEFLRKHQANESDKIEKTIKKQLLQEEQKDG